MCGPNENWVTEISDTVVENKKLPKIGDRILSMWSESMWQYFHATIRKFDTINLKYEIDWDDGDTTGMIIFFYNTDLHIANKHLHIYTQKLYKFNITKVTPTRYWT